MLDVNKVSPGELLGTQRDDNPGPRPRFDVVVICRRRPLGDALDGAARTGSDDGIELLPVSRRYGTISGLFQHLDKTRLLDVGVSDLRDRSVGPVMARPRGAAQ